MDIRKGKIISMDEADLIREAFTPVEDASPEPEEAYNNGIADEMCCPNCGSYTLLTDLIQSKDYSFDGKVYCPLCKP